MTATLSEAESVPRVVVSVVSVLTVLSESPLEPTRTDTRVVATLFLFPYSSLS